ncbi:LRR receptor-like serine/threonine-protein kinase FLS2 [Neltuma alba]|uniref:LRR receptor-like serine/threonine-protein kinase FLS2 n=1 Tax=Neltuma alba TaxID=207710 RepID=UPI0010A41E45|nr:LRR receptor-like serine/threonine-protein kinase FLS2 [Prosopis alba]
MDYVDLSNNLISDDISNLTLLANISYFDASHNSLSGSIFSLLCHQESDKESNFLVLDLSHNNLSGTLPLGSLNLSRNHLIGKVSKEIGGMKNLESLDLTYNKREIISAISNLSFLDYLNLSYNNCTGLIPLGIQIQIFDPWSFVGNDLCGDPLPKKCYEQEASNDSKPAEGNEDDDFLKHCILGWK